MIGGDMGVHKRGETKRTYRLTDIYNQNYRTPEY